MVNRKWDDQLDVNSVAYKFACSENKISRSLAGPGTGKTFSLMRKIAYLLEVKHIQPEKILIITFTRAASGDITKELSKLEIEGANRIQARTLHSFCLRILMNREVISSIDRFPRPMLPHEIKVMLNDINENIYFGNLKHRLKFLHDYESAWARLQFDEPGYTQSEEDRNFQDQLVKWMKFHKSMTIGEVVPFTLDLLRFNPELPVGEEFSHVLVDEYQDLNKAEQVIIDKIAENAKFTVVGDDNQSIYKFKNARPEGIRIFHESHNPCTDFIMDECRRCPKKIVKFANSLIINDPKYKDNDIQVLIPHEPNGLGEIGVIQWRSIDDEVNGISDIVDTYLKNYKDILKLEDILILDPSRRIAYQINEKLNELGINSQLVSKSVDLVLGDPIAKEIFEFLYFVSNRNDLVSFRYLLHKKNNWYQKKYVEILRYAEDASISTIEVFKGVVSGEIKIERINSNTAIVKKFIEIMHDVEEFQGISDITELERFLLDKFGLESSEFFVKIIKICDDFNFEENKVSSYSLQISNYIVNELINLISSDEDLIEEGKIRVMTCHSAKGLDGKLVIICSCVDGLLPRTNDAQDIDEQRRLFYVALTRCKYTKKGFPGMLIISSFVNITEGRKKRLGIDVPYKGVRISNFLREINQEYLPRVISGTKYLNYLRKSIE